MLAPKSANVWTMRPFYYKKYLSSLTLMAKCEHWLHDAMFYPYNLSDLRERSISQRRRYRCRSLRVYHRAKMKGKSFWTASFYFPIYGRPLLCWHPRLRLSHRPNSCWPQKANRVITCTIKWTFIHLRCYLHTIPGEVSVSIRIVGTVPSWTPFHSIDGSFVEFILIIVIL